jgi:hypothetical protein
MISAHMLAGAGMLPAQERESFGSNYFRDI